MIDLDLDRGRGRGRSVVVAAVIVAAVIVALGVTLSAAVVADEDEEIPDPTEEIVEDEDEEIRTLEGQLDRDTRLVESKWNESTGDMSITVANDGDSAETVQLIEIRSINEGLGQMIRTDVRAGDETEIDLSNVEDREGDPAVIVATDSGLEQERYLPVPTGQPDEPEVSGTFPTLLLGIGIAITGTIATAWHRYNRVSDAPEPMEDEL